MGMRRPWIREYLFYPDDYDTERCKKDKLYRKQAVQYKD